MPHRTKPRINPADVTRVNVTLHKDQIAAIHLVEPNVSAYIRQAVNKALVEDEELRALFNAISTIQRAREATKE